MRSRAVSISARRQPLPGDQRVGHPAAAFAGAAQPLGPTVRVPDLGQPPLDGAAAAAAELRREQVPRAALEAVVERPGHGQEHDVPEGEPEEAAPQRVLGVIPLPAPPAEMLEDRLLDPHAVGPARAQHLGRHPRGPLRGWDLPGEPALQARGEAGGELQLRLVGGLLQDAAAHVQRLVRVAPAGRGGAPAAPAPGGPRPGGRRRGRPPPRRPAPGDGRPRRGAHRAARRPAPRLHPAAGRRRSAGARPCRPPPPPRGRAPRAR